MLKPPREFQGVIAFISEALTYNISHSLQDRLNKKIEKSQDLKYTDADRLLSLDIISCRPPVNQYIHDQIEQTQD